MEKLRLKNNYKPAEFENVGLGVYHYRTNFLQTASEEGEDEIEYDEIHFRSIDELDDETADAVMALMSDEDREKHKSELLSKRMKETEEEFLREVENMLAESGSEIAKKRKNIRNKIDKLGKVMQTEDGNGTMENPYKGWKVGDKVKKGMWYLTEDGYLWEAIRSGTPTSTTDDEYFDVVGL